MIWTRTSPWDGHVTWSGAEEDPLPAVDAVAGAPWWPVPERRSALERLAAVLTARRAEAVDLLIREAGKVRRDAEAEADLLPKKIQVTLAEGWRRYPPEPVDGLCWRPRGLAVVLGPFNFPLHLLHGLVVPALAMGNPVVAKPSERTPALGAWYRERIREAGLEDRCRVVLGGPATAAALVADPRVATVAAVGSRPMGLALSRALAGRPEVVLALELGGIGHVLMAEDADLEAAAPVLAEGAWRMAGQRCNATRIVHVPRAQVKGLQDRLSVLRQLWMTGDTPEAAMGPLIDGDQRDRFIRGLASLAQVQTRGRAAAEPVLVVTEGSEVLAQEHFGPLLALIPYDDQAVAVARMALNPARLSGAIWTRDPARFAALAPQLPYGCLGWNRSTSGARSDQPFGGCGIAGNGRPAAVAAGAIFADETVWG